ncbi:MAG: hypothetical protein U0670_08725 [Anaerolineae bacterium]
MSTTTDPRGTVTRQVYDSLGRISQLIMADGRPETATAAYGYDALNRQTTVTPRRTVSAPARPRRLTMRSVAPCERTIPMGRLPQHL